MLLDQGKIKKLTNLVNQYPDWLHACLLLVEDEDTSLTIRVGISAIFESLEATQISLIYDALIMMTKNSLARIRSDACFYLSLTNNTAAIDTLKTCLQDKNDEVREIAADAITDLEAVASQM
jgi:HEAT repeat protein